MGLDFSEKIEVHVIEEKANAFTFVLPRSVVNADELSEKELQKVAGGACMQGKDEINTAFQLYVTYVTQIGQGDTSECHRRIGSSGPG